MTNFNTLINTTHVATLIQKGGGILPLTLTKFKNLETCLTKDDHRHLMQFLKSDETTMAHERYVGIAEYLLHQAEETMIYSNCKKAALAINTRLSCAVLYDETGQQVISVLGFNFVTIESMEDNIAKMVSRDFTKSIVDSFKEAQRLSNRIDDNQAFYYDTCEDAGYPLVATEVDIDPRFRIIIACEDLLCNQFNHNEHPSYLFPYGHATINGWCNEDSEEFKIADLKFYQSGNVESITIYNEGAQFTRTFNQHDNPLKVLEFLEAHAPKWYEVTI